MIRYYCNKCNREIHSKMLRITTANEEGEKKGYHLCNLCTSSFNKFMSTPIEIDNIGTKSEDKKDVGCPFDEDIPYVPKEETVAEDSKSGQDVDDVKPDTDESGVQEKKEDGRRSKYLTEEAKQYIEQHKVEKSASQLAKDLEIPYQCVYQYLRSSKKKFGEVDAKATDNLSAEKVGTCVALRRSGWNIKDIADEIGSEMVHVVEALKAYGMK